MSFLLYLGIILSSLKGLSEENQGKKMNRESKDIYKHQVMYICISYHIDNLVKSYSASFCLADEDCPIPVLGLLIDFWVP